MLDICRCILLQLLLLLRLRYRRIAQIVSFQRQRRTAFPGDLVLGLLVRCLPNPACRRAAFSFCFRLIFFFFGKEDAPRTWTGCLYACWPTNQAWAVQSRMRYFRDFFFWSASQQVLSCPCLPRRHTLSLFAWPLELSLRIVQGAPTTRLRRIVHASLFHVVHNNGLGRW